MVRSVNRQYLTQLFWTMLYWSGELFFCGDCNCKCCKKSKNVEEKLRKKKLKLWKKSFNTFSSKVVNWKVTYYKIDPTILATFPMHE